MAVTAISTTIDSSIVPSTQAINTLNVRMTEQEVLLSEKVTEITGKASQAEFLSHKNNLSNPHAITPVQIGAATQDSLNTTNSNLSTTNGNLSTTNTNLYNESVGSMDRDDEINGRVSNIVAQAGTGNTELIDARGIYATVGDRLNDLNGDIDAGLFGSTYTGIAIDGGVF